MRSQYSISANLRVSGHCATHTGTTLAVGSQLKEDQLLYRRKEEREREREPWHPVLQGDKPPQCPRPSSDARHRSPARLQPSAAWPNGPEGPEWCPPRTCWLRRAVCAVKRLRGLSVVPAPQPSGSKQTGEQTTELNNQPEPCPPHGTCQNLPSSPPYSTAPSVSRSSSAATGGGAAAPPAAQHRAQPQGM